MNLIVKQASALSSDELAAEGLTGIPTDWPIESALYTGSVPDGYTEMTDIDMQVLKDNNQTAYDAWVQSQIDPRQVVLNKIIFGKQLVEECTIQLGALNDSADQVIGMLSALMPIQGLLQAGALTTAKGLLSQTIGSFSGDSAAVLQYAIDSISSFGY